MRRHTVVLALAAVAALGVLFALAALVGDGDEVTAPTREGPPAGAVHPGRVVAGAPGGLTAIDPHTATDPAASLVTEHVYDRLVRPRGNLSLQPALATSWEADDEGTTWTFALAEEATFHDGTPVTAGDAAASLERARTEGAQAHRLDDITGVEAVDDHRLAVRLDAPAPDLPARLGSSPSFAIVPAVALTGGEVDPLPPGTGPLRPAAAAANDRIVLERVDDPWREAAALPELEVRAVADAAAGLRALRAGEIDWLGALAPEDAAAVAGDEGLVLGRVPGLEHWSLVLNHDRAPFDEPAVRRAVARALDRPALAQRVRAGAVTPDTTAMPPDSRWHVDHAPFPHEPEAARQALADAGHEELAMELLVTDELTDSAAVGAALQEQLGAIGIDVDVRERSLEQLLAAQGEGEFDAYALGWAGALDPHGVYYPRHHSAGARNFHGFADEEVDERLEAARRATDPQARQEHYAVAVERLVDLGAELTLLHTDVLRAWSARLSDVTVRPDGRTRLEDARLAGR